MSSSVENVTTSRDLVGGCRTGDMGELDHHRRRPTARWGALVLTVCVLAACSAQEPSGEETQARSAAAESSTSPGTLADQTRSPAASTSGTARVDAGALEAPSRRPAVLAEQLDRAIATLRDHEARPIDVRRAGELQQLAVRTIATSPEGFRGSVMRRLDTETEAVTRPAVRAAAELHGLTDPQPKLPPWRIVRPPPPEELMRYYERAQRRTGVPWRYLAAIHLVETRMGRIRGTSTAGARGPMQFLPSTWDIYGAGGDIDDPRDAILAAARLLKANGAPGDMRKALWHYNPSNYYVRAVSSYARTLRQASYTYRGYWHWRVLYRHDRGTYVLPVGYPTKSAELLRER
jgi:hypothetical protein